MFRLILVVAVDVAAKIEYNKSVNEVNESPSLIGHLRSHILAGIDISYMTLCTQLIVTFALSCPVSGYHGLRKC